MLHHSPQARTQSHQWILDALMRRMYLGRSTRVGKRPPRADGHASTGVPPPPTATTKSHQTWRPTFAGESPNQVISQKHRKSAKRPCLFCVFVFLCFVFLSFCCFVFLSGYHCDQMSEGSEVSKVTLCVKILKWHSPSQSLSQSVTD